MPKILRSQNPAAFKTQPLWVEACSHELHYQPQGYPLNFHQMHSRRVPVDIPNPTCFHLQLANLGVSVRLTLEWHNSEYWVLVKQRRPDRNDVVLKLISGYVPAQELGLPLLTAVQEIAEECLLETPEGWLSGRVDDCFDNPWIPRPYAPLLNYRDNPYFTLSFRTGATRPVRYQNHQLMERPRAYVHQPTASLQLVYDMHLAIPKTAKQLSLFHVDELLEGSQLVTRLERSRPGLYLLPLKQGQPTNKLLQLRKGELVPVSTRSIWLAESFAPQEGWVVTEDRIRWKDWIQHCGH